MPESNNLQPTPNPGQAVPYSKPARQFVRDVRPRGFKWMKVAIALAEGKTAAEAAEIVSVQVRTIHHWRRLPAFQSLLARYQARIERDALSVGIASKTARLLKLDRHTRRIERIIDQRAQALGQVPEAIGGDSGLIAHDQKGAGAGFAATVVDVYEFDAALSREYRAVLEQGAKEMGGQFEDPQPGERNSGVSVTFNFPVATPEQLEAVNNAPVIDLPPMAKRLLTRPSDGKQR